jgi:parvulin-like peptidyl-prolyl isomerase
LRVEDDTKVTNAELLDYYIKNKDKYTEDEEFRVSIITVGSDSLANKILAIIKNGGSFEKLAKKYSTDKQSSTNGGDLGWVSTANIEAAVAETVFSLEDNQLSGVVKSENFYHIIKVTGKRNNYLYPLADVRDNIMKEVLKLKQRETFEKIKSELKSKFNTKTNYNALGER